MKPRNIPGYFKLLLGIEANETLGINIVTRMARRVLPGYRFTWPQLDWFRDPRLSDVLKRFDENEGLNAHRRFALQQLLRLTFNVPGDTVECGVYQGCSSYIILQANQQSRFDRIHHVFDSFEGLSKPTPKDGEHWTLNDLKADEGTVKENLKEFSALRFYKGWIPDRFSEVGDRSFSFVHVDVDLYGPTLESVKFFYERLNPGGILVCDDYACTTCPGATAAMDEFLASKPEKMVSLAGGGGFFVKGCLTSLR